MTPSRQPGKEAVRAYLLQRLRERTPLPTQSEIRRRLGWDPVNCPRRATQQRTDSDKNG